MPTLEEQRTHARRSKALPFRVHGPLFPAAFGLRSRYHPGSRRERAQPCFLRGRRLSQPLVPGVLPSSDRCNLAAIMTIRKANRRLLNNGLASETASPLPKLKAVRHRLPREIPRCRESLSVAIGAKVLSGEKPKSFPKQVALIPNHDSIRLRVQAGVRATSLLEVGVSLSRQR